MWWRETCEYKRMGVWQPADDDLKISLFSVFVCLFRGSYTGMEFFGFGCGVLFIWRLLLTTSFVFESFLSLAIVLRQNKCWVGFWVGNI